MAILTAPQTTALNDALTELAAIRVDAQAFLGVQLALPDGDPGKSWKHIELAKLLDGRIMGAIKVADEMKRRDTDNIDSLNQRG
jgi:hypothetical protein